MKVAYIFNDPFFSLPGFIVIVIYFFLILIIGIRLSGLFNNLFIIFILFLWSQIYVKFIDWYICLQ